MRSLFISLGITVLTTIGIIIYFKKRLAAVEHKLNMMFQLIEDHHNQQRVAVTQQHVTQQQYPLGLSSIKEESHPEPELITVSDDSDSDSDISSTSSNSTKEEGGVIHIKNEFEDGWRRDKQKTKTEKKLKTTSFVFFKL